VTVGRPARLTDVVTAADAAALPHPSCRPLVRGLLAVLDDPGPGADPASTRHAWVELDLLRSVPPDVRLDVTARLRGTARLGSGDGLWIDVDVDGPDGPVVRSRHVVAATLARRPRDRRRLPTVPRPVHGTTEPGALVVDAATMASYRRAAGDSSAAHAEEVDQPIVPGLLALWSALAHAGLDPAHVEARFVAPLPVGAPAAVVTDGRLVALRTDTATVLRAATR